MAVIVPASKAEMAIPIISEEFEKNVDSGVSYNQLKDCYLFVPPEHTLTDEDNAVIFNDLLNRHMYHMSSARAYMMTSITTHLNRSIRTKHKGEEITMHDLIINIPIPDDDLDHLQLFRSVDFC